MITEQMIWDSLKAAKWSEDIERRKQARKQIDYYQFRQNETCDNNQAYMQERIAQMFPNTASDMYPYISTYPITEQIINDISILFSRPPIITPNPDEELPDDNPSLKLFKEEIIDKPLLYPNLVMVNRLVNLTGKVAVMPRWYEAGRELEYVVITPDKCFVLQDPDSPNHITAIVYQVDTLTDTPQLAVRQDDWIMITAEEVTKLKINATSGAVTITSSEPNIYKVIPVAWFTNSIPIDGFWNDKGNPIVERNEQYNVNKTLEKLAITYQMYSTLVLTDVPPEKTINWGVRAVLSLEGDPTNSNVRPDAKYITPSPLLAEVSNIVEGDLNALANYAGLSKEAYRKDTNTFASGYQLELSKQDVINNAELEIPFYTQSIKTLLKLACLVYSTHSGKNLETLQTFSIDYQPLSFKKNPLEIRQQWQIDKNLGIMSPIDMIMELNSDLTREQAVTRFEQVKQDLEEYGAVSNLDALMGLKPQPNQPRDNQATD
jgi:hypothetical protein